MQTYITNMAVLSSLFASNGCKWADYNGVRYKEHERLIVLPEECWKKPDEPTFGRVQAVAALHGQVKLTVQVAAIHEHLHHHHAYSLKFSDNILTVDDTHLTHPHPLHIYRLPGTHHTHTVIPKYHISIL